jgi:hypothetical protein
MKKYFLILIISIFSFSIIPLRINAQSNLYDQCISNCNTGGGNNCSDTCSYLQGEEVTACGLLGCDSLGIDPTRFEDLNILQIASVLVSFIFVAIIALGVFFIIKAVFKIIRSEGDSAKVEEGSKIFRGIFIGLFIILAGIVGIVLMVALFQAGDVFNTNPEVPELPSSL